MADLLTNAIPINNYRNSHRYAALALGYDGNNPVGVFFIVNRHSGDVEDFYTYDITHSSNVRRMEEPAAFTGPQATPGTDSSITLSIKDVFDIVKRRFSDIIPMDVLNKLGVEKTYSKYSEGAMYSSRDISNTGTKRSQEAAKQASELFNSGVTLTDYFNSGNYDNAVAAQLRGMMLRNGQDVGGKYQNGCFF